jgi:hypothetical protein
MSNHLPNGAVLPHGLLGENADSYMDAFKKTYQNNSMRVGVITESYGIENKDNLNRLVPEYDVLVFEQNEDQGSTTINYRHCIMANALGSIADFFEMTMRPITEKKSKGPTPSPNGQNGSLVLILCLNGLSDSGIIVGALSHPDRKSTLKDAGPRMEGEYNGVNIKVEKDGSTSLTFRGATDNYGKPLDKEQGDTVIGIEKDGTFQIKHKTITQRLAKDGKTSLTADDDISNTTNKNFNVTATENIAMKATKNFSVEMVDFLAKASGSATLECQKLAIKSQSDIIVKGSKVQVEAEAMAKIKATQITLDGLVSLGGEGGVPVLIMTSIILGIGNLGMPVISTAITGAFKVNAQ